MSEHMGVAFDNMRFDMRGKLGGYMHTLQARYGDPRVYAMQQEQMAAQESAIAFAHAQTRSEALTAAYAQNRDTARQSHASRMRSHQTRRPGSAATAARAIGHTPSPLAPSVEPPAQV